MSLFLTRDERQALRQAVKLLDLNRWGFVKSVAAGSAALGSSVSLGAVSAWLIARAAQMPPVLDLQVATVAVRTFGIGKALFRYIQRIFSHRIALHGMGAMRARIYERLSESRTDSVAALRRGDLLARTGADVDALGDVIIKSYLPLWVAGIVSLLSVGIVGMLSPAIGCVLAACLLGSAFFGGLFAVKGTRAAERHRIDNEAALASHSLTMLESANYLRVTGTIEAMNDAVAATEADIQANRDASARPVAAAGLIDTLCLALTVIGALIIGTAQLTGGTLNGIELAVCVLTPLAAFEATSAIAPAAVQAVISASAAERIMALLNSAEADTSAHTTLPENAEPVLTATDLVVAWPDGDPVAGPINLSIRPGQSLAIVGKSGIGKTTLLYTLAGMLAPREGSVELDGHRLYDVDRESASHFVVLTAEDAHIFDTSILENIRVARRDVTEEEAVELLAAAGLSQWLASLPEGVHTEVGLDAAEISGGERRRLLIARALASKAPLLLLDEPAEHLDTETADQLLRDLLSMSSQGRGVVVVTHRLTPLDAADHVIMIDDDGTGAKVIAEGTHAELCATVPAYRWAADQED